MKKSLLLFILAAVIIIGLPAMNYAQESGIIANVGLYGKLGITSSTTSTIIGNVAIGYPTSGTISLISTIGTTNTRDEIATQDSIDLVTTIAKIAALSTSSTTHVAALGGGESLAPGVYSFTGDANETGTLTLSGAAGTVYIFNITGNLTFAAKSIIVATSTSACNVFWVVGGTIIGTSNGGNGGTLIGTFISKSTGIAVQLAKSYTLEGRILAQNGSITLDALSAALSRTCTGTYWKGNSSATTDFSTALNWSNGLPSATNKGFIPPTLTTNYAFPALSATTIIGDLSIQNPGTLSLGSNKLQISGILTSSGTISAISGTVEMTGSTTQTLPQNVFTNNIVNNLIISNTGGSTITPIITSIGGTLTTNVTGTLSFGSSNNTLSSSGYLTLASTSTATAQVPDITNALKYSGNTITGSVNVQRYFPIKRAWHLLTAPTTGASTIFNTWQNGGAITTGIGMLISGVGGIATPTSGGLGIDYTPRSSPSLYTYSYSGQSLSAVTSTNFALNSGTSGVSGTAVASTGYFAFLRGDRSTSSYTSLTPTTTTTLTSVGSLITGNQSLNFLNASTTAVKYALIANPYASPINYATLVTASNNLPTTFYTWDPSLNSVGGYVTLSGTTTTPYTSSLSSQKQYIEGGQAFFIPIPANATSTASVTINFTEAIKNSTALANTSFRPMAPSNNLGINGSLTANLYLLNSDSTIKIADGTLTQFNNIFSDNVIVDEDAIKFTNINESFGLSRHGSTLAIESRPNLSLTDTLFFNLSRTSKRAYRLQFEPTNLDNTNLVGYLQDKYLNTAAAISLTNNTPIDFNINIDVGSYAADRFQIVFKTILPFAFTNIAATKNNSDIAVDWNVANETDIIQYEIEKSTDGITFLKVNTALVKGDNNLINNYTWLDANSQIGNNIYRVKMLCKDGSTQYSKNVTIIVEPIKTGIAIFPNPIKEGKVNIKMGNQPLGAYQLSITNNGGQTIYTGTMQNSSNNTNFLINLNRNTALGIYNLQIVTPQNKISVYKLILE